MSHVSYDPIVIRIGSDEPVTLAKEYGPLIFADLRITADFASCEWVIERQRIDSLRWVEVARIPGQLDEEYDEQHTNHEEIPE